MVDPGSAERVIATALRPAVAALGDSSQAAGPPPTPLSSVVSGHSKGVVEGVTPAIADPSTLSAADPGSSRGAQAPGVGVAVADLGGSSAPEAAGGVANVMIVRRDMGNTAQVRVLKEDARPSMPRLAPQNSKPAHTRAVASLDGSRCVVIVDTGADVSLVSASDSARCQVPAMVGT